MSYLKLNDTAVIIESDGQTVLVCSEFDYNELELTGTDSSILPKNYITNYFGFTQGVENGYTAGGYVGSSTRVNTIDKWPFASNNDATDIANLTNNKMGATGTYSKTNGYVSGGFSEGGINVANVIEKFPFASDDDASDIANLTLKRDKPAGQSSPTHGYTSGGAESPLSYLYISNIIDKFTFASDADATDVGDVTVAREEASGQQSTSNGYTSGGGKGTPGSTYPSVDVIDKFSFASDGNATDVGNLTSNRRGTSGQSSLSNGYACGGTTTGSAESGYWVENIERFPFSSDTNSTEIAELFGGDKRSSIAGHSSETNGFSSGGSGSPWPGNPTATFTNRIEKFSFASDADGVDLGDLTQTIDRVAGVQV